MIPRAYLYSTLEKTNLFIYQLFKLFSKYYSHLPEKRIDLSDAGKDNVVSHNLRFETASSQFIPKLVM